MKILHLANHAQMVGNGIVNVMVDLACLQADAGHEVAVASAGGTFEELLRRHGAEHKSLVQTTQPWRVPQMLWGLHKIVDQVQPDIIHAHMMTGAVLAWMSKGRSRYTLVTTIHNEFQKSSSLMRLGDSVVAVSDAVKRSMVKRGIDANKMHVVRNGVVGAPRFHDRTESAPPHMHHPNIVTVSGLYERKGMHDLLRAFQRLKRNAKTAHLYFVGDGPDKNSLEALARDLGLRDSTHFAGYVANPEPYLKQADVFVLPSHSEGSPLALMEAREAGCAIVATAVGGIPETLDYGAAGIIVPVSDHVALSDELESLLNDEGKRRLWQTRARENLESITAQRVYSEYMQVYVAALSVKRKASLETAIKPMNSRN